MSEAAEAAPWRDAALAAALLAVDPFGLGGVSLRAHAGPVRDRWLGLLRELLPPSAPWRRVPHGIADGRLLGGLDLSATLRSGRPVAERGLLAEADGGVVVLPMAERLSPEAAGRLAAVLDMGEVAVERDGLGLRPTARLGLIALDEGLAEDEGPPAALLDRLAFRAELGGIPVREAGGLACTCEEVAAARLRLAAVRAGDEVLEALCAAAVALGVPSLRAPLLALKAARAAAALAGRAEVSSADAALAARLVLAPRATRIPADEEAGEGAGEEPPPSERDPADESSVEADPPENPSPQDLVLAAARAAIPPGLLAALKAEKASRGSAPAGRAGALRTASRGRPAGLRRGEPRGARLNLVETLRAAAPWQALRRGEGRAADRRVLVEIRRDDFRLTRHKKRSETTTIFAVDASGSSALHRLAEAKGAVELLLADCYVRRDRVALLAFRGSGAELLLPPTRSLVRAKRGLAALPGGGGTPLAAGIDAALGLAVSVRRRGATPVIVLLTDGRANVARRGGRSGAQEEALKAAAAVRTAGLAALLVDISPRPQPSAERLAGEMGARYLPLPNAEAGELSRAIRDATAPP